MKKAIMYCVAAIGIISFTSCASAVTANQTANNTPCECTASYTPTETSLTVKNETKKMLWSHIDKIAGVETADLTYYFVMHKNKSFSVIVTLPGTQQYDFRAGTFQAKGDTLHLNYYKNIQSDYLSDKAVVNNDSNEIYFLSTEQGKSKRLKVLNQIPQSLIAMLFNKVSPKNSGLATATNNAMSVADSR